MNWLPAFVIFLFLTVALTLLRRSMALAATAPPSVIPVLSYVLGVMPVSIVVGLTMSHHIEWSLWTVFLLITEGLFCGIFTWLSLVALKLIPAAHFQTIFQLHAVLVIIFGWTLLGEKLGIWQIIGAALILAAGILASWAPVRAHMNGESQHPHLKRGVILTIVCAVAMGIGLVAEKAALGHMDLGAYFIFGFGAQTISVLVIAGKNLTPRKLRSLSYITIRSSTVLGIVSAGVGFSYLAALSMSNNVSLITALKAFALPMTAVAAHYILHERDDNKTLWTAIVIGVTGLVLTTM